jgi:fatty acid desaturase
LSAATPVAGSADEAPRPPSVQANDELPVARLRRAVADLFAPRPAIYWGDFLLSAMCFYAAFAAAALPLGWPLKLAAGSLATLALYRTVVFIHEIVHQPPGRLPGFRLAWNLLCGIPLLVPDFLYAAHADHHARHSYGTAQDAEYWPWGRPGNRRMLLVFLSSSLVGLPAGIVRFGVLGPLSWLSPRLAAWVECRASALAVRPGYRQPPRAGSDKRIIRLQEIAVFAYLAAVAASLCAGLIGAELILQLYLIASAAQFVNALRTLVAHRYRSAGTSLSATQQMLDSLNYDGRSWLIPLWAPLGLRFHALHHLMPGLPYHNLGAAHRRLLRLLPSGSPYHRATAVGLVSGLRQLWFASGADRGASSERRTTGEPATAPDPI